MKLKTIINAVDALNELQQKELPIEESFKVVNIIQQIEPHFNNYSEQREKLMRKYGNTEDRINYTIKNVNVAKYLQEIEPLENLDIEIKLEKIKLNKDISIKAVHLRQLLDFVELKEGAE